MSDRHCRFTHTGLLGPKPSDRLKHKSVMIVGCGALGSAVASLLIRLGVGKLKLVDFDVVQTRNLGDQYLFHESDVTKSLPKVVAAARNLSGIDNGVEIEPVFERFAQANATSLFKGIDIAIDGADDVETKYLINDTAVATNTPWVYGGCAGAKGTVLAVIPGRTNCLRCIWPVPPMSAFIGDCMSLGLLPTVPAMVAAIQVTEGLKILLDQPDDLLDGPIVVDCWDGRLRSVPAPDHGEVKSQCLVCGPSNHQQRKSLPLVSLTVSSPAPAATCTECDGCPRGATSPAIES